MPAMFMSTEEAVAKALMEAAVVAAAERADAVQTVESKAAEELSEAQAQVTRLQAEIQAYTEADEARKQEEVRRQKEAEGRREGVMGRLRISRARGDALRGDASPPRRTLS